MMRTTDPLVNSLDEEWGNTDALITVVGRQHEELMSVAEVSPPCRLPVPTAKRNPGCKSIPLRRKRCDVGKTRVQLNRKGR